MITHIKGTNLNSAIYIVDAFDPENELVLQFDWAFINALEPLIVAATRNEVTGSYLDDQ